MARLQFPLRKAWQRYVFAAITVAIA